MGNGSNDEIKQQINLFYLIPFPLPLQYIYTTPILTGTNALLLNAKEYFSGEKQYNCLPIITEW